MSNQNKILICGKSFTLSILVFAASILANLGLFCLLAMARTTSPVKLVEPSEPKYIINIEMSPPIERENDNVVTDTVALNTSSTEPELPEPVLEKTTTFSRPDISYEDIAIELPGLPFLSSDISLQVPLGNIPAGDMMGTLTISQVDIVPSKTFGSMPQYPRWAQIDKMEGTVTLRFIVTEKGNVESINIREIEGDERFGTEAVRAVTEWRFKPAIKSGKPVACWCFLKIDFKIPR